MTNGKKNGIMQNMSEINHKEIKKGDILYESSYGMTVQVEVISEPVYRDKPEDERISKCDTWELTFEAKCVNGIINYKIDPIGLMYNCGRLYKEPTYSGSILLLNGKIKNVSMDGRIVD